MKCPELATVSDDTWLKGCQMTNIALRIQKPFAVVTEEIAELTKIDIFYLKFKIASLKLNKLVPITI